MELKDKIIVITGAASGIGAALATRFTDEQPKHLICTDIQDDALAVLCEKLSSATKISCVAMKCDVSREADIAALIKKVESDYGAIDLFCSNAGILTLGGAEVDDARWTKIMNINVMSHVWAARHLLPQMIARGDGYFFNTASAAGLLTQVGSAPYSVTKAGAVSFAEWLAVTHGVDGIKVSVLCPQAVDTAMTAGFGDSAAHVDGLLAADDVAEQCLQAIKAEQFLVLPHKRVHEYMKRKADDTGRWIQGMQKLQAMFSEMMKNHTS